MKISVFLKYKPAFCLLFLSSLAFAQPPTPGKPQDKPIVLKGGTIHTATGQVLPNTSIAFENGKITDIGTDVATNIGAEIIDVSGKHIYPGLILPNTSIGLVEISAVRATNDVGEVGEMNPNVRALIAYNADSEIITTTRSNGILLVQTTPQDGVVSGMSSVMQLDAWNWEDAAYRTDDGIHLNYPPMFRRPGFFEEGGVKPNENRNKVLQAVEKTLADGLAYSKNPLPEVKNLKLEAMKGLYDGTKNLYLHADYGKEIVEGVQLAKKYEVKKIVIVGGEDAYLAADFLKENNIPVLLNSLHRLPNYTGDDVDLVFKEPFLLKQAGVLVGLSYSGGSQESTSARNLPFVAGNAVPHGLSKEEALQMITANTAKILGIDNRTGTLEKGKDANIVVSDGDLLDMRTNNVTLAFIQGRKVILDDKQKRLYKRFSDKYGK
jgi:imidazolonepropionase-like amidohydrolase